MNYYAQVIEILANPQTDHVKILREIAKTHPKIVCVASKVDGLHAWKNECARLVKDNLKVAAVKLCREHTGMSLIDAKNFVESL